MNIIEKTVTINEACDLFNEAAEKIRAAKKMFKKCGIDFCGGFDEKEVADWEMYGYNLHVYTGIKKLSNMTGVVAEYPQNEFKTDRGYMKMKYRGLVFLQKGSSKDTDFKFK